MSLYRRVLSFAALSVTVGCGAASSPSNPASSNSGATFMQAESRAVAPFQMEADQPPSGPAWMSPAASSGQSLLYAAHGREVLIFPQTGPSRHTPIGRITDGIDHAWGMAVDSSNTLYVANRKGSVTIYPAGSLHPSLTLVNGLFNPVSVAIASNKDVYVVDLTGKIPEYHAGQSDPFAIIPKVFQSNGTGLPVDAAFDKNDNLFVTYLLIGNQGLIGAQVAEYTPGSMTPLWIGVSAAYSGGVTIDTRGRLVMGQPYPDSPAGIAVYNTKGPTLRKRFGDTQVPWALRFAAGGHRLYVGDPSQYAIFVYDYPSGRLVDTIKSQIKKVNGVALSPPGP